MLHQDTIDDFFFHASLDFLQLRLAIRSSPTFPPLFDRRGLLVGDASFDPDLLQHWTLLLVRNESDVIIGQNEVESPDSCVSTLVTWWLDDTVDSSAVESPREELKTVSRVYNLRTRISIRS